MVWYYADEQGNQAGPVSETDFAAAVKSGAIHGETLVWREGFDQWLKYSIVAAQPLGGGTGVRAGQAAAVGTALCNECGGRFPQDELVDFGGINVCAACKPKYVQKLREGATIISSAGFWRKGKQLVMPLNGALPRRCVKCNTPVEEDQIRRKLYWHHPAVYAAVLINILVYALVALCVRKTSLAFVSLCPQHRSSRRTVIILSWLCIVAGLVMTIYGFAEEMNALGLAGIILFLGAIIFGIVKGRLVYATKIDKEHVWLGGCKPVFLAEFPEWEK
jgi:hypothetical protein